MVQGHGSAWYRDHRLVGTGQVNKDWKEGILSLVQLPRQVGWGPKGMRSVLWGDDSGREKAGDHVMLVVCLPVRRNGPMGKGLEARESLGCLGSHTDTGISKRMCLAQRLAHSRHYVGKSGMGSGAREFRRGKITEGLVCRAGTAMG